MRILPPMTITLGADHELDSIEDQTLEHMHQARSARVQHAEALCQLRVDGAGAATCWARRVPPVTVLQL